MKSIRINERNRADFIAGNYDCIHGSKEENILCIVIALFARKDIEMNAENFVCIFNKLCQFLYTGPQYTGFKINYDKQPGLKGSQLDQDIRDLKGKKLGLQNEDTIRKIAYFFSNDDEFCNAVVEEFELEFAA